MLYDSNESTTSYQYFQANDINGNHDGSAQLYLNVPLGSSTANCNFNLTNTGFTINPINTAMYYQGCRYVALKTI